MNKTKSIAGGSRTFTCKRCGCIVTERMPDWRKKKQQHKNVCLKCLEKSRIAAQVKQEKAKFASYGSAYRIS